MKDRTLLRSLVKYSRTCDSEQPACATSKLHPFGTVPSTSQHGTLALQYNYTCMGGAWAGDNLICQHLGVLSAKHVLDAKQREQHRLRLWGQPRCFGRRRCPRHCLGRAVLVSLYCCACGKSRHEGLCMCTLLHPKMDRQSQCDQDSPLAVAFSTVLAAASFLLVGSCPVN